MDGKDTFFAVGREHEQFYLPAFDEIDHLIPISTEVDVGMFGYLDRAGIYRLSPQRIAQLLFEQVRLGSLLNHNSFLASARAQTSLMDTCCDFVLCRWFRRLVTSP